MSGRGASRPHILLLGGTSSIAAAYPKEVLAVLAPHADVLSPRLTAESWRDHRATLAQADYILSTWGVPCFDQEFLECASRLKGVFYAAGSVKSFATPVFYARGIVLSTAVQANAIPVAEFAVSAIILSLKGFWRHARQIHRTREWKSYPVPGAYRSSVGLLSLGAVGRLTAEKLTGYELDVLAYDPFVAPEAAAALGVRLVSLEELFAQADVVSLHPPWLPETENLVGASLLRSMKPGATLLNTARGAVIDERALCEMLRERPDLTAILDVTHPEPPPSDSPLFRLENIFLTPHIAGSVGGEVARMGQWMVEELLRQIHGEPLRYAVTEEMLEISA
jgi:phosphoglycerate dehydrogenase-like enzyme